MPCLARATAQCVCCTTIPRHVGKEVDHIHRRALDFRRTLGDRNGVIREDTEERRAHISTSSVGLDKFYMEARKSSTSQANFCHVFAATVGQLSIKMSHAVGPIEPCRCRQMPRSPSATSVVVGPQVLPTCPTTVASPIVEHGLERGISKHQHRSQRAPRAIPPSPPESTRPF